MHANALGILTGAWPVIIPPGPGVLCAYGDATTQVQDEAARTYVTMAVDATTEQLLVDLHALRDKAAKSLNTDGIAEADQEVFFQADLRYAGQAYQISLDFSEAELREQGIELLITRFDAEHEQLFTFALDEGHEIVMIRALVKAKSGALADLNVGKAGTTLQDCKLHDTRYYYDGDWHDAVIYDRNKLHEGLLIPGPAIITEMDATTVILPGYEAAVDKLDNLVINPLD